MLRSTLPPLESGSYGRANLALSCTEPGKFEGHFSLPWSRDDSGWGAVRIPIGVLTHGEGPTVLLTGANHGDEIEGAIALSTLFTSLQIASLQGTVILVPMLNYPAFRAGKRLSPIDGGNMNRSFLGRAGGTITEQIAYFVESELIARAEAVLDIHAGGRTMMFCPFAVAHRMADDILTQRARDALQAFGAPIGLVLEELDSTGMLDAAVEAKGKLFLSTELGGGGSATPATLDIAYRGIHNFLIHTGVLRLEPRHPSTPSRIMTNDASGYISCDRQGLIEYVVELGASVQRGQTVARIHDIDRLGGAVHAALAPVDGLLLGRLHGGLVLPGDFLALIAQDL